MGAASAVGLAVSVVRAIIHGGRSLLTHCRFPDAIGYSSVTNECPFDPTRIYVSTPRPARQRVEPGFFFLLFFSPPSAPRLFCCNLIIEVLLDPMRLLCTCVCVCEDTGCEEERPRVSLLSRHSSEPHSAAGGTNADPTPFPRRRPLQAESCQSDCQSGSASARVSATPALQAQPHVCNLSLPAPPVV